jgi:hypothetical protein
MYAPDDGRQARVRRAVADKVLADESIFTTPVGLLSDVQAALLQAALAGPHADEIVAAMDAL